MTFCNDLTTSQHKAKASLLPIVPLAHGRSESQVRKTKTGNKTTQILSSSSHFKTNSHKFGDVLLLLLEDRRDVNPSGIWTPRQAAAVIKCSMSCPDCLGMLESSLAIHMFFSTWRRDLDSSDLLQASGFH